MDAGSPVSLAVGGSCGRIGHRALGSLRLSAFDLPAEYRKDRHAHARPGAIFVLAGAFEVAVGTTAMTAGPGRAALLPHGAPHRERAGRHGARCLLLEVDGTLDVEGVEALLSDVGTLASAGIAPLIRSLWRGLREDAPQVSLEADALESLLLLHSGVTRRTRAKPPWLGRAVERLHQLDEAPSGLEQLAEDVGVSPEHLARSFRTHAGCSVGEFLRRAKLLRATDALRLSSIPLSRVAQDSGFADQSHMTRVFRRYLGVTPLAYRRRHRTSRGGGGPTG